LGQSPREIAQNFSLLIQRALKRAIFHPTILAGPDWAPFLYTFLWVWVSTLTACPQECW
jgi:hypothetical protein